MLRKNVKFRKGIEEKLAFGVKHQLDFGLSCPECTGNGG